VRVCVVRSRVPAACRRTRKRKRSEPAAGPPLRVRMRMFCVWRAVPCGCECASDHTLLWQKTAQQRDGGQAALQCQTSLPTTKLMRGAGETHMRRNDAGVVRTFASASWHTVKKINTLTSMDRLHHCASECCWAPRERRVRSTGMYIHAHREHICIIGLNERVLSPARIASSSLACSLTRDLSRSLSSSCSQQQNVTERGRSTRLIYNSILQRKMKTAHEHNVIPSRM
jgi:hypothetical protein